MRDTVEQHGRRVYQPKEKRFAWQAPVGTVSFNLVGSIGHWAKSKKKRCAPLDAQWTVLVERQGAFRHACLLERDRIRGERIRRRLTFADAPTLVVFGLSVKIDLRKKSTCVVQSGC